MFYFRVWIGFSPTTIFVQVMVVSCFFSDENDLNAESCSTTFSHQVTLKPVFFIMWLIESFNCYLN